MLILNLFLSSPGDLTDERARARAVVEKLQSERANRYRLKIHVEAWDKPGASAAIPAHMEPQEAIDARLLKPSQCDIVVVLFGYRMGTPLSEKYRKPCGERYWSGSEYEFSEAVAGAESGGGKPIVLLYRKSGAPNPAFDDPQFEEKRDQWQRVQKFFGRFKRPDGSLQLLPKSFEGPTDFERILEDDLRDEIARRFENGDQRDSDKFGADSQTNVRWKTDPYPGLSAFGPSQAPIFFGRGHQTDALLEKLARGLRFLAVVGASGSGKSSLVAAGLGPRLQNDAIPGSRDWIWRRFTPGENPGDPVQALAKALSSRQALLKDLSNSESESIHQWVRQILQGKTDWSEILLFIDQFEELFTLVADTAQHTQFINILSELLKTSRVRIVVTMRAEFFGRCIESNDFRGTLTKWLNAGSYFLEAPDENALKEMIERPGQLKGLRFEKGLVDRIIKDTGSKSGNLALMAFALEQLYRSRTEEWQLTWHAYESFGGVEGAIADRATAVFEELSQEIKEDLGSAFSAVFRELVEVDENSGVAIRKRVLLRDLPPTGPVRSLVTKFTQERLLVTDEVPGVGSRQPTLEVAHEALFRSWPRLRDWIEARKEQFLLRKRLQKEAAEWVRSGRPVAYRWSDERALAAAHAIRELSYAPTDSEKEFLGPTDTAEMLRLIERAETTHEERATIGVRLARLGDPRPGVGLRPNGLPDICWRHVPQGRVVLEGKTAEFVVNEFWISKYPVTYSQFRVFVQSADGYRNPVWWEGLELPQYAEPGPQFPPIENHPAVYVDWLEAVAYCRWISSRLEEEYALPPEWHRRIRLPTEWEWQQAATGGNANFSYPWGRNWDPNRANTSESKLNRLVTVGLYAQDYPVGRPLDMAGNTLEWCLNEYENPLPIEQINLTVKKNRALRGGAWHFSPEAAQCSHRRLIHADYRDPVFGFRLICSSPSLSSRLITDC